MLVAVICDDRWHPADVVIEGLSQCSEIASDIHFEYILDTTNWSNDNLDRYGAVVLSKANARSATDYEPWLSGDVQEAFLRFVERGGGLLVIHSGIVGYADQPLFLDLVGGVFVHHPEPCPVTVETLDNATIPEIGLRGFTAQDEHYLVALSRDDLNVFMASTSIHGVQPAGWSRDVGEGRVCVLTPGHFSPVWAHPDYRHIIASALHWCAAGRQS